MSLIAFSRSLVRPVVRPFSASLKSPIVRNHIIQQPFRRNSSQLLKALDNPENTKKVLIA